jgi:REP-associated tyrosine transposase
MSRPRRIEGFDYRGRYRYLLTFCTIDRKRLLAVDTVARQTLFQIRRTASEEAVANLAYCIMLDHVHLLVEGTSATADLRRFVTIAKRRSGALHALTSGGRLWQEGYYERVLREHDDIRGVCRYILENPVRSGLCERPEQWPHSGSDIWTMQELFTAYE